MRELVNDIKIWQMYIYKVFEFKYWKPLGNSYIYEEVFEKKRFKCL